jgi:hypothetical protein
MQLFCSQNGLSFGAALSHTLGSRNPGRHVVLVRWNCHLLCEQSPNPHTALPAYRTPTVTMLGLRH